MKNYLKTMHRRFCFLFFDPLEIFRKWRGIPYYLKNRKKYNRLNKNLRFGFTWKEAYPVSHDRFSHAGSAKGHYFWQDLWAAQYLYDNNIREHTDVGSRFDGFVAHILPFCKLTYIDIRPLEINIRNFNFRQGSVLQIPFEDNSVNSLSSLHVIEHIGLGRYGDPVDPDGHIKAAKELSRVLTKDGLLLIGVPVGSERLCFDAHRVFDPKTIADMFAELKLTEFHLIDDTGMNIIGNASFDEARRCNYGCGLFVFRK